MQRSIHIYAWLTVISLLAFGLGLKATSPYPYPFRADLGDLKDRAIGLFHEHPQPSWLDKMWRS